MVDVSAAEEITAGIPVCLLNPRAGTAAGADAQLPELFARLGRTVHLSSPHDMGAAARKAVESGASLVIAGGGDGSLSAVAQALVGSATALGVLPLGTFNHFAKDLGVPLELEAAVATAFAGEARPIDVAEVNGRIFLNNSSIGVYANLVRAREALQARGERKWRALAHAAPAVFRRSRPLFVQMRAEGRELTCKAEFIFVGNNEYELAAPKTGGRTRLDGGTLWVSHLPHTGRFHALGAALLAVLGGGKPPAPLVFTTEELRIESRAPQLHVAMDGEVLLMKTPLTYRIRPRALKVMVPRGDSDVA
jgi:diacylglycerol kinase family enzyme